MLKWVQCCDNSKCFFFTDSCLQSQKRGRVKSRFLKITILKIMEILIKSRFLWKKGTFWAKIGLKRPNLGEI